MSYPLHEIFPAGEAYAKRLQTDLVGEFKRSASPVRAANDNRPRFQLTWFEDIKEDLPKEQVIYGAFGVNEFSTVVGKPGTGKSVIVTDAACHVAAGLEWHGRRVKQGLVIYFAAERKALTERRMRAFRKRHGIGKIPLAVVGGKLDMTRDLSDAKALAVLVKEAESISGASCVWIILDTLSRTFGGGDQNASKDMGKFVQAADEIMRATGAHVTVIHHSPWNEDRGKGAIDLDGAVDASFVVSKSGKTYTLRCDGTNDGEEGPITSFGLESVEVGIDAEGKPTTAPVVVPKALGNLAGVVADVEPTSYEPTGINGKALTILRQAIDEIGEEPEGPAFPPDILVVMESNWRDRFRAEAGVDANPETVSRQYRRAVSALIKAEHVKQVGDWVWAVRADSRTRADMSGHS